MKSNLGIPLDHDIMPGKFSSSAAYRLVSLIKVQTLMRMSFFALVCSAAEICLPAFCEVQRDCNLPPALVIEGIVVEGNRFISDDQILNAIQLKPGDKFGREKVLQGLKDIARMGYFDDKSIQAMPELSANGVLLKFKVQENVPVTEFAFHGNSVLSTEDLADFFLDQLGKPQNLTALAAAIDKVEQYYHEKGYSLAHVTDVKDDPDGSLHIEIIEGIIDSVEIVGDKKFKTCILRNPIKLTAGTVYNKKTLTEDLIRIMGAEELPPIRHTVGSLKNSNRYVLKIGTDDHRNSPTPIDGPIAYKSTSSELTFTRRGQIVSFGKPRYVSKNRKDSGAALGTGQIHSPNCRLGGVSTTGGYSFFQDLSVGECFVSECSNDMKPDSGSTLSARIRATTYSLQNIDKPMPTFQSQIPLGLRGCVFRATQPVPPFGLYKLPFGVRATRCFHEGDG